MSGFDEGYRAGTQGMQKAIDTAHLVGAIQERKRILELLKNPNCKPNDHDYTGGCNCDAIILINGENK